MIAEMTPSPSPPPTHCSYGVIIWELYTGLTPFVSDPSHPDKLMWRSSFPTMPSRTPRPLRDMILACLHPQPEQRPDWPVILQVLDELAATELEVLEG